MERHAFEVAVLHRENQVVADLRPRLTERGLSTSDSKITNHPSREDPQGVSEIVVYVYRNANIEDAVEFFVWQDGRPTLDLDEIQDCLTRFLIEALEDFGTHDPKVESPT